MNVLSLFDGISCGRVALERCGFTINKYYASEIDKYAITVAANNYLDTIHIGDVTKVRAEDLEPIDLLIGGSPCQGFSFAGKQLNFEDPRSKLFFEFVRLLKECKPKYFFLENVVMKKEYQDVISSYLGVQPIMLNSALVSAQSRKRLYWTNITGYTPPEDKGILLRDIVHEHCLTDRDKSHAIIASIGRTTTREYFQKNQGQMVAQFNVNPSGKGMNGIVRSVNNPKSNCLTTNKGEGQKISFPFDQEPYFEKYVSGRPTPISAEKHPCLRAQAGSRTKGIAVSQADGYWRKLTPIECERLQTLPDNYTAGVSNSQRYKMLGNGWTVDAVCEFFKHIPKDLDLF